MALFTQVAVKEKLKARVAIDGPTGSGKTWTALQWAMILAGIDPETGALLNPVGLIDTENRSAAYYAPTPGVEPKRLHPWDPPYTFFHLPKRPPYDPMELAQMIEVAHAELGDDGVLVVDSLTHYWNGEGGTLDAVDKAAAKFGGNSYAGWKEGTPLQRHLLDTIIHAPFHVICTMRSKMDYLQVETEKGGRTRTEYRKVGMAPEQRSGVEYEFTIVADMDLDHRLVVSKSRCDVIADVVAEKGRSAEVAVAFKEWLGTGVQRLSSEQAFQLVAPLQTIDDVEVRKVFKSAFMAEFGAPSEMLTDKLAEATEWVAKAVVAANGPARPPETQPEPSQPTAAPEPDPGALLDGQPMGPSATDAALAVELINVGSQMAHAFGLVDDAPEIDALPDQPEFHDDNVGNEPELHGPLADAIAAESTDSKTAARKRTNKETPK